MEFQWMNESKITEKDGRIEIYAPAKTDFFITGLSDAGNLKPVRVGNAPFYYTQAEGDFVLRVKVSLEFKDTYDSACVMVMQGPDCWAKCCFELTDFGTHAVVSVVTKGESDDANGCNIDSAQAVWLKVCRRGNYFSFHYSLDGETYWMMRYFSLPAEPSIKVGLLAQAPTGNGGIRVFENLELVHKTVEDLRKGE